MKQLISINNYDAYKKRQWKKVDRLYELKLFSKHVNIISKLPVEDKFRKDCEIICVGARYGIEIEAFKQLGFVNVKAIDIYPRSNEIIKADMHNLPFDDNSFDIVYTHHSLDHSLFPLKAVKEMFRVSRKCAFWIHTVPFNDYGIEEAIDFDTPEEITDFFGNYTKEIIYRQSVMRNENGFIEPPGFCLPTGWRNELRIVLEINKQ